MSCSEMSDLVAQWGAPSWGPIEPRSLPEQCARLAGAQAEASAEGRRPAAGLELPSAPGALDQRAEGRFKCVWLFGG